MNKMVSIKNIFSAMLLVFAMAIIAPNYAKAQSSDLPAYSGADNPSYNYADYSQPLSSGMPYQLDANGVKADLGVKEEDKLGKGVGHGIVSDGVVGNILSVNLMVSQRVSDFLVLGNALHCFAWNGGKKNLDLLGVTIARFPDISFLVVGLGLMLLGMILVIVIGYYLVDISFKLGFSVMALPIAIALWPFPKLNGKLGQVISTMLHSAGILIFLSLGVAYLWALFDSVFNTITVTSAEHGTQSGVEAIYTLIEEGKPEPLRESFQLFSINVLILMFAGLYGFQLIGKLVNDYTNKFFPDAAGTGGSGGSPMHHQLTKATDFTTKMAMKPVRYAKDVAKTQTKRAIAKGYGAVGKGVSGLGKTTFGKAFFGQLGKSMQKRADDFEDRYQELGKPKEKQK